MFTLKSHYRPSGDQSNAIAEILNNLHRGFDFQTLWGVTGSGKTFTMANIIQGMQKPTLIIAHNKTLAAQLAQEFKEFFPMNAVHYFVSYYDYYQPEAYVAKTDTYIEKEATINEEIDRLRHAATQDLLTRKDVIIVASVSCIYGIGDIDAYKNQVFTIMVGQEYHIEVLLKQLVSIQYKRSHSDFKPGHFLVRGDVLEIYQSSSENVLTIEFWGDEVTQITRRDHLTGEVYEQLQDITIFPAKHTVTTQEGIALILPEIRRDLHERLIYFKEHLGDILKYERLKTKVEYDIEMMGEVGYVNGIENYSRYLDGRQPGEPPATLMDYFPKDFLCFVDESHMTFSQIGGMYAGDRARKINLVENGFRLPSALDNRPLQFDEFEKKVPTIIAVSATPGGYEIGRSIDDVEGKNIGDNARRSQFFDFDPITDGEWKYGIGCRVIPQVIRPTGLLDPEIILKPMDFVVDDIMTNISEVRQKNQRMLITTITKRSSEELSDYLIENGVKVRYLHSEIETLERLEILKELREGVIDVIVGVNLLREGLDLPEVSKIAILDADKQGFLRSTSSLIQIIGRAARNQDGRVYMYTEKKKDFTHISRGEVQEEGSSLGILRRLDKGKYVNIDGLVVSVAMKKAIDLTYYRRNLQKAFNAKHGITPKTIFSSIKTIGVNTKSKNIDVNNKEELKKTLSKLELEMDIASANMEYEKAAELRDKIIELKKRGS